MKLYLSSYRVPTPEDLVNLVGKKPEATKVALVPNAKDYYAERARNFKNGVVIGFMREMGFDPDLVDLRDFDQDELAKKLSSYDLIWVAGGNTFCLREAMKNSGFDNVLPELLNQGTVYGGDSAGAIVVGPTLKGAETADEPEFSGEIIWEGLSITNKIIIPHADNESLKYALEPMLEMYKNNPDAIVLNDNQAYIINGDEEKIITGV